MMQSVRERIPEFAILKACGYGNGTVATIVFAEAAFLCVSSALVAFIVADAALLPAIFGVFRLPPIGMPMSVALVGLASERRAHGQRGLHHERDAASQARRCTHAVIASLSVTPMRETDYYAKQSAQITAPFTIVSYLIGAIMGIGAVFAALNSMYTAVSARSRDIATLRAMGFNGSVVMISVLIESLLLSIAGGALGAALAWALLTGRSFGIASTSGDVSVATSLQVTFSLVETGLLCACLIGLIGGLFPALRAGRATVATVLHAL